MTKIKICGLSRLCDVDFINSALPDYCGFIIGVPSSKRNMTVEQLRMLRARLRPEVIPVGVFVDAPVETVAEIYSEGLISVVQLHGHEDNAYIGKLKALMDAADARRSGKAGEKNIHIRIIQALKVRTPEGAGRAERITAAAGDAESVLRCGENSAVAADAAKASTAKAVLRRAEKSAADMVLLDGGAGDGRVFDWSVLSAMKRPYILAGGLGPENLSAALDAVHPWGVDMSSGVETDGFKDEQKIMNVIKIGQRS